jgi:hypothetical protein
MRKMSISNLLKNINAYMILFPNLKFIYFTDEDFFARPLDELREFADVYSAQIGIPFQCMAAPNQITEEKMATMVKAGLINLNVGLESGSERIRLDIFNRHITDERQIQASITISRFPQVNTTYFLIIGNPYEEREDLLKGIRFLERMPYPFSLTIYNLVFIPGTKLYDQACIEGIIAGPDDSASNLDFVGGYDYRTHDWKKKNLYLNSLLSLMNGRFTERRLGLIPRKMIPILNSNRLVDFFDRYSIIGKTVVALGMIQVYQRRNRSD